MTKIISEMWGNTNKPLFQKLQETMYERGVFQSALDNIAAIIQENEGELDGDDINQILEIIGQAHKNASESEQVMQCPINQSTKP